MADFTGINQPFKWLLEHKLGIVAALIVLLSLPVLLVFSIVKEIYTSLPSFLYGVYRMSLNKNPVE